MNVEAQVERLVHGPGLVARGLYDSHGFAVVEGRRDILIEVQVM